MPARHAAPGAATTAGTAPAATSAPRKLTWKERRELEDLEREVPALEARQAALAAEINASGADFARLAALSADLAGVGAALEIALERWIELSEIEQAAQTRT